jgi:glycosyltransferase involved in cell wall biosynthesis
MRSSDRKLAYIIAGHLDASFVPDVDGGARPCTDFMRFSSRNDAALLSADDAGTPARWMGWMGQRIVSSKIPLAGRMASIAPSFSAFVTSGEDIGVPLALALLLRRSHIPLLIQVHGHYFENKKFAALAPILRSMSNVRLLCLSTSLRDQAVQKYGFNREQCHSVGYGVDTNYFSPVPVPANDGVPLIVSAGLANRDYRTLIAAVRNLPVKLRIAADSPWITETDEAQFKDSPPGVEVRSAGDYRQLRDLYAQASFVVVPMRAASHACGYAVMAEAMAMGKAVVATRLAAPCDFFRDPEHGYYVDPTDVAGLRDVIQRLLADPAQTIRLGMAARRQMEQAFSLDRFCERIEQHLPAAT